MTTDEMRSMLTAMTEETDSDTLSAYIKLAEQAVLTRLYPFDTTDDDRVVPARYEGVQLEIAAYLLNKRGAEGEKSHTENGITRSYENGDIPDSLLRRIVPTARCF